MTYVISDIHGCYTEYIDLLNKIDFCEEDELYILGDVVDRGPQPIEVLRDMMVRPNVILIMGNHDYMFYHCMEKLMVEITEENYDTHLSLDDLLSYRLWLQCGGETTVKQFVKLPIEERREILSYLTDAQTYEVLEHENETFILAHAGLGGFGPDKALDEYELYELLEERADYGSRYFKDRDTYLITGHTPTLLIEGWERPEVYQKNGHIAIDCGCVGGGKLAAFCIETKECFYV